MTINRCLLTVSSKGKTVEPVPVARGQELGIFNLGSTTIVIGEPKRMLFDPLPPGATVRMGQPMGRLLQAHENMPGTPQR